MSPDPLTLALRRYQHLDPRGWLGIAQVIPPWLGFIILTAGVVFLLMGGGRAFRVLAGPMGAIVGAVFGANLLMRVQLPVTEELAIKTVALGLFIAGVISPTAVLFVAFGIPLGLMGGQLAGSNDYLLGFVPGFLLGGVLGALLSRSLSAVLSAVVGGWLLVIGALTAFRTVGELTHLATMEPWVLVTVAMAFAVAGSIYQLAMRPLPAEQDRLKAERIDKKHRAAEQRAVEKRWRSYHR